MYRYAWFFKPYFPAHFVGFLFFWGGGYLFLLFSLLSLSLNWKPTLFVQQPNHLFLRSYGHSVKEIAKLLEILNDEWTSGQNE